MKHHELYPHQVKALEAAREKYRSGKKRVVLKAACGFGKTTVAAEMIRLALEKGRRTMFIADRIKLIDQASDRLDAEGIEHGVIQGSHWRTDYTKPVQVASIQTIARRQIPDFEFVVIDECHVLHKAHIDIMKRWDNVPVLGLSATPFARGMGRYFQDIVVGADINDLIDGGFLVRPRVFSPSAPDLSGVLVKRGDYDVEQLGDAADKPKLVANIVETWIKNGRGRLTMAFAVRVSHSMSIVEEFKRYGVRAEHVDGYMEREDQEAAFRRLRTGDIEILSSVDLASRGVDIPEVSCAIVARPTKSLMLHHQMIGRVIRSSPGKLDCIVNDHAGNTERLGFITDDVPAELDDGSKAEAKKHEREEPLPTRCPSCKAMRPAKVYKCPECGFEPKTQAKSIEVEEGILTEKMATKKVGKIATADKEIVYAEILGLALEKGWKPGFAYWAAKDLFGSAPRIRLEPRTPSDETRRLVKYLFIKRNAGDNLKGELMRRQS